MRKEPDGDHCPEGFEYVHGHRESDGRYVRSFCRKIPKKRIKLVFDMKYPGNTTMKISGGQGIHRIREKETLPTENLFEGKPDMMKFMNSDWTDTKEMDAFSDRINDRKKKLP